MLDYQKGEKLLEDKIRKKIVNAMNTYNMIENGDHVLVAVSGGKDSTILALMLEEIRKRAKIHFTYEAVLLDQKQPGFNVEEYSLWLDSKGVKLKVIEEDTYSIVREKVPQGKTTCGLCSRLRRGILYNHAFAHGFNKIALGHHREDLNETVLMNMLFTGRLASMPPKLKSDDGRNTVIRPLCFVDEGSLIELNRLWHIPVIPCNLCGSQENLQRKLIKQLIQSLEEKHPDISSSLIKSQANIKPSQMLDPELWNFDV